MTTVRKNISLTEQQAEWLKAQVDGGDYATESDYFRDLIRRDQRERSRVEALRTAIDEGIASGVYEGDAEQAIAAIRAKLGISPRNG